MLKRKSDKEECLNSAIRDAIRAENFAFATQICDFIVNDEIGKFGAFLRIKALMWLTDYIAKNLEKKEYSNFVCFVDCLWKFRWIAPDAAKSSMIEKELIDEMNETMLFYYESIEGLSLSRYYKALTLSLIHI